MVSVRANIRLFKEYDAKFKVIGFVNMQQHRGCRVETAPFNVPDTQFNKLEYIILFLLLYCLLSLKSVIRIQVRLEKL